MARTWLRIRVDLLEGLAVQLDPPPGRVFIVGPGHTFQHLAEAIDAAFARWDLSHLHVFDLGDDWRHRCRVLKDKADPVEEYGVAPRRPAVIWGWGSIPDQYAGSRSTRTRMQPTTGRLTPWRASPTRSRPSA